MINELPLILIYISSFGISDLIVKKYNFCDKQKFVYYILLLVLAFFLNFYKNIIFD